MEILLVATLGLREIKNKSYDGTVKKCMYFIDWTSMGCNFEYNEHRTQSIENLGVDC